MYSEENLFKTIIVSPSTTVGDAIRSASSKFKSGKPELFTMRMVAGGKGIWLSFSLPALPVFSSNTIYFF